jgi:hypothetical protein
MHVRRSLTALSVLGIILAACLGLAPTASAATVNVSVDCDSDVYLDAHVGDTVIFTLGAGCGVITNGGEVFGDVSPHVTQGFFGPETATNYDSKGDAWFLDADWYVYGNGLGTTTVTTTIMATNGYGVVLQPGSVLGTLDHGPFGNYAIFFGHEVVPTPMWQQAIGRTSETDACPIGYNPSWAMWPNKGTGGYVCDKLVPA